MNIKFVYTYPNLYHVCNYLVDTFDLYKFCIIHKCTNKEFVYTYHVCKLTSEV